MSTFIKTSSAEETRDFGQRLAAVLEAGDVIAVEGDLGAGKTELVKGIAEGLGVTGSVHSPTFVLHHRYRGRLPVEHYDLYRLEGMAWVDTGLDEPAHDAVTVIEWPERAAVLESWAVTLIRIKQRSEQERELSVIRAPKRIRDFFEHAAGD